MTSQKLFPVKLTEQERDQYPHCPAALPWSLVEAREQQAQANHGQSLEQLAEQGGLAPKELYAIINGLSLSEVYGVGVDVAVGFLGGMAKASSV